MGVRTHPTSSFSGDDDEVKSARRGVEKLQWELQKRRLAQAERKRVHAERKRVHAEQRKRAHAERDCARELLRRRRDLYRQFMGRGDLVFDVGANVGNRVEVFLSLHARVVAVEPLPECAQRLRDTFQRRCIVLETALGAAGGTAELRRGSEDVLSTMSDQWIESTTASGRFADDSWGDVLRVNVTTLDALISDYGVPRFTKIDVEGFEPEVLAGLSTAIPALSIEYALEFADHTGAASSGSSRSARTGTRSRPGSR